MSCIKRDWHDLIIFVTDKCFSNEELSLFRLKKARRSTRAIRFFYFVSYVGTLIKQRWKWIGKKFCTPSKSSRWKTREKIKIIWASPWYEQRYKPVTDEDGKSGSLVVSLGVFCDNSYHHLCFVDYHIERDFHFTRAKNKTADLKFFMRPRWLPLRQRVRSWLLHWLINANYYRFDQSSVFFFLQVSSFSRHSLEGIYISNMLELFIWVRSVISLSVCEDLENIIGGLTEWKSHSVVFTVSSRQWNFILAVN